MLKNNKLIKIPWLGRVYEEPGALFVIPNPYDDLVREKKGSSSKKQKQGMHLKNLKMQLPQPCLQQATVQQELQLIKTYFANLPNQLKKNR